MKISPKKFITSKYGYNDLVAWNSTLNMTREERIQWESGVIPWAKANFKSKAKVQDAGVPRSMTCRQYIEKVEEGSLDQIGTDIRLKIP